MKKLLFLLLLPLVGMGCAQMSFESVDDSVSNAGPIHFIDEVVNPADREVTLPLDAYQATYKRFGEFIDDRFYGYHVAEDLEVIPDNKRAEPVYAIADGTVSYVDWVPGYGGVIVITHDIGAFEYSAVYGHLDIGSTDLAEGDEVQKGDRIAILGEGGTREADGERKHLHFALYGGGDVRLRGYVEGERLIDAWINPVDFFARYGIDVTDDTWVYASDLVEPSGRATFPIDFEMPGGWDIEWVPGIESWNLYEVAGNGTALERSKIFIRYFDASDFLTLKSVDIHSQEDRTVGLGDYTARRYDIEKRPGIATFPDQPSWRNERHIVTDFRGEDGFTRYFVVAANPDLNPGIYERVLASMEILD